MLGDFITRILVLLFGYAYPAFECFRSVEKNRIEIEELRFWCQYWIIIAILTVCERIGDVFISWLPMYGEVKLAFFIYLWYPRTKGTGYIYETLLRPFVTRHETEIDRKLLELRARAWDLAIYYWQNCTNLGQSAFFQILEYLSTQSGKFSSTSKNKKGDHYEPSAPPAPELWGSPSMSKHRNSRWPPQAPPPPPGRTIYRAVSDSPKSNRVQVHLNEQTEYLRTVDPTSTAADVSDNLQQARMRLRLMKPIQN